ncbi:MAG: TrkA family potassium uptake protein [Oscillospiraceae bacterium]|nr:TrkA family potassium uptake protein [Oscillospiraceae bacterium]
MKKSILKQDTKSFLIIGMGSFGHHLCHALVGRNCEVMAVDQNREALEDLIPLGVVLKAGDCTKVEVLRSFDIERFDACFVCLGDNNVLGSLQITDLLKSLGAKKVFSKADDDVQAKFLERSGADYVIYPEKDVAYTLAVSESSDKIFDCIHVTGDLYIYELEPMQEWIGKSLLQLNFRAQYNLTVIGVKRKGAMLSNLKPDRPFHKDEHLMVLGQIEDIQRVIR